MMSGACWNATREVCQRTRRDEPEALLGVHGVDDPADRVGRRLGAGRGPAARARPSPSARGTRWHGGRGNGTGQVEAGVDRDVGTAEQVAQRERVAGGVGERDVAADGGDADHVGLGEAMATVPLSPGSQSRIRRGRGEGVVMRRWLTSGRRDGARRDEWCERIIRMIHVDRASTGGGPLLAATQHEGTVRTGRSREEV